MPQALPAISHDSNSLFASMWTEARKVEAWQKSLARLAKKPVAYKKGLAQESPGKFQLLDQSERLWMPLYSVSKT